MRVSIYAAAREIGCSNSEARLTQQWVDEVLRVNGWHVASINVRADGIDASIGVLELGRHGIWLERSGIRVLKVANATPQGFQPWGQGQREAMWKRYFPGHDGSVAATGDGKVEVERILCSNCFLQMPATLDDCDSCGHPLR